MGIREPNYYVLTLRRKRRRERHVGWLWRLWCSVVEWVEFRAWLSCTDEDGWRGP